MLPLPFGLHRPLYSVGVHLGDTDIVCMHLGTVSIEVSIDLKFSETELLPIFHSLRHLISVTG
jgi:hypothetical protein